MDTRVSEVTPDGHPGGQLGCISEGTFLLNVDIPDIVRSELDSQS